MKKILAILLAALMLFSLAACTAPEGAPQESEKANEGAAEKDDDAGADEIVKLRLNMTSFTGEAPAKADIVLEAFNKELREKAGAEVEFVWVGFANMQTQLNLLLTGGDDSLDILNSFWYAPLGQLVTNGQVMALDDLLASDGTGITELFEPYPEIMNCGKVGGKIYGIPTYTAWSSPNIYMCDATVAEGIDISGNMTINELTEKLVQLKEKNPDKYFIPGATEPYWVPKNIDYLGDTKYMGVLLDPVNSTTVENYFESEDFLNFCENIKIWKEKDIISPDAMSNTNPTLQSFKLRISYGTPGYGYNMDNTIYEANMSQQYDSDIVGCEIGERLLTTGNVSTYLWHVTSFCKHPEAAMKVLNLMFTDPVVANIFSNGVEHETYEIAENGQLTYCEGAHDADTAGWSVGYAYTNPNDFLCPTWDYQREDANELMMEDNANAIPSKALGFVCDLSPVADQYGACSNVFDQYYTVIMNGECEIDEVLPVFQQELKNAGIDDIIAEKQSQLDAWLTE